MAAPLRCLRSHRHRSLGSARTSTNKPSLVRASCRPRTGTRHSDPSDHRHTGEPVVTRAADRPPDRRPAIATARRTVHAQCTCPKKQVRWAAKGCARDLASTERPRGMSAPPPPLACVSIPELGLQALLRRPEFANATALALIDRPGPQTRIAACTESAQHRGVRRGMRASVAMGLCEGLHTIAIDDQELASIQDTIGDELGRFSPRIEPGPPGSGTFWLDPSGMARLYGPPLSWAKAISIHLEDLGWRSTIVVGFRHFLTRALAESSDRLSVFVFKSPQEEAIAAQSVPLRGLGLPPRRVAALASLQVDTLGDLIRLPSADLRARFGVEVAKLQADASGSSWRALRPRLQREPARANIIIDPPEKLDERLLFAIKGILPKLIEQLRDAGEKVHSLALQLLLDRSDPIDLTIEIAVPTAKLLPILDLIRLRLGSVTLESPVSELVITLSGSRPTLPQLDLLAERERR
ncbi:MAG TPA: DNA polymerase Y family protein, partial [Nannocystis exedens]|nr:DNA polymerase Y family protein [Nannocystis exedens]